MIKSIQDGAKTAVGAMQEGSAQVEVGVQYTGRAGNRGNRSFRCPSASAK